MIIDMVEEVYKDLSAEEGGPSGDPFADEMRKAWADSQKKMEDLKDQIDKLAESGFSIDNENKEPKNGTDKKEPEDGTETENESEENKNEDQNT